MKICLRFVLLALLFVLAWGARAADDFEPYSIIVKRNIFNPNRRPGMVSAEATTLTTTTVVVQSAPARDTIDLLGTWISDKQALAFTEGSRPELTATPAVGGELGGWRVAAIDTEGILLADAERRLRVRVGERIERGAGEDWKLTARGTLSTTTTLSAPASTPSDSGALGSAADIIKRMREKRLKETAK